jgi:type II secretory pathway component PulC
MPEITREHGLHIHTRVKRSRASFVRVGLPVLLVGTMAHIVFAWTSARHCADSDPTLVVNASSLADGPRRTEAAAASDPRLIAQLVASHVACHSRDACLVDARLLEYIFAEPTRARQQAVLVPVVDGTGVVGVALQDVRPEGLFGALRLRDGDVITRIGGEPVDAVDGCLAALGRARGPGTLAVSFLRDGQPARRRITLLRRRA